MQDLSKSVIAAYPLMLFHSIIFLHFSSPTPSCSPSHRLLDSVLHNFILFGQPAFTLLSTALQVIARPVFLPTISSHSPQDKLSPGFSGNVEQITITKIYTAKDQLSDISVTPQTLVTLSIPQYAIMADALRPSLFCPTTRRTSSSIPPTPTRRPSDGAVPTGRVPVIH